MGIFRVSSSLEKQQRVCTVKFRKVILGIYLHMIFLIKNNIYTVVSVDPASQRTYLYLNTNVTFITSAVLC